MEHNFIKKIGTSTTGNAGMTIIYLGNDIGWKIEYFECENCKMKIPVDINFIIDKTCDEWIIKNIIE